MGGDRSQRALRPSIESQQGLQAHPGGRTACGGERSRPPLLHPPVIRWGLALGTGVNQCEVAVPAEGPGQYQRGLTEVMQKGAVSLGTVERWAPLCSHLQDECRDQAQAGHSHGQL